MVLGYMAQGVAASINPAKISFDAVIQLPLAVTVIVRTSRILTCNIAETGWQLSYGVNAVLVGHPAKAIGMLPVI